MKAITLVSHLFDIRLTLRVSNESYERLKAAADPMQHIADDIVNVIYNEEPHYISKYQARKIDRFFDKRVNANYFDKIEF